MASVTVPLTGYSQIDIWQISGFGMSMYVILGLHLPYLAIINP